MRMRAERDKISMSQVNIRLRKTSSWICNTVPGAAYLALLDSGMDETAARSTPVTSAGFRLTWRPFFLKENVFTCVICLNKRTVSG